MSLTNKIREMFSRPNLMMDENNGNDEPAEMAGYAETEIEPDPGVTEPAPTETSPWEPTPPAVREVIQAPMVSGEEFPEDSPDILIKAQPTAGNDQCIFRVNRPLLKGRSWYFDSFESAAGSPLAEALFSLEDVETVLVLENTLNLTRKDKSVYDWKPFAVEAGARIRKSIEVNGDKLVSEEIVNNLPSEEAIRDGIQKVLDTEVNPGVAGHGGKITLLNVRGNTVTIHMGGGCQGCSAADLTLKQGIHSSFRNAVPQVGAILDETDHSAGLNPYFS